MLCSRCRKLPKERRPASARVLGPHTLPGWERLRFIMCSQCGDLLPPADPKNSTLDKLGTLARFGLSAGTSTILES